MGCNFRNKNFLSNTKEKFEPNIETTDDFNVKKDIPCISKELINIARPCGDDYQSKGFESLNDLTQITNYTFTKTSTGISPSKTPIIEIHKKDVHDINILERKAEKCMKSPFSNSDSSIKTISQPHVVNLLKTQGTEYVDSTTIDNFDISMTTQTHSLLPSLKKNNSERTQKRTKDNKQLLNNKKPRCSDFFPQSGKPFYKISVKSTEVNVTAQIKDSIAMQKVHTDILKEASEVMQIHPTLCKQLCETESYFIFDTRQSENLNMVESKKPKTKNKRKIAIKSQPVRLDALLGDDEFLGPFMRRRYVFELINTTKIPRKGIIKVLREFNKDFYENVRGSLKRKLKTTQNPKEIILVIRDYIKSICQLSSATLNSQGLYRYNIETVTCILDYTNKIIESFGALENLRFLDSIFIIVKAINLSKKKQRITNITKSNFYECLRSEDGVKEILFVNHEQLFNKIIVNRMVFANTNFLSSCEAGIMNSITLLKWRLYLVEKRRAQFTRILIKIANYEPMRSYLLFGLSGKLKKMCWKIRSQSREILNDEDEKNQNKKKYSEFAKIVASCISSYGSYVEFKIFSVMRLRSTAYKLRYKILRKSTNIYENDLKSIFNGLKLAAKTENKVPFNKSTLNFYKIRLEINRSLAKLNAVGEECDQNHSMINILEEECIKICEKYNWLVYKR